MGKDIVIDFRNIHPTNEELQAVIDLSTFEKNVLDVLYRLKPGSDYDAVVEQIKRVEKSISENVLSKKLYPSDYELALFANLAYKHHNEGELIDAKTELGNLSSNDWVVHKYFDHSKGSGYSATVFVNHRLKQVVLAHRGTSSNKEIVTDFSAVLGLNPWAIAVKHSSEATKEALHYAFEQGYYLSITGHSLGGFYSELSAYGIFFWDHYHVPPRIVTFDSPGAFEFLKAKQDMNGLAAFIIYPEKFENLGVVNYCLGPNLINTINKNIGTTIMADYRELGLTPVKLSLDDKLLNKYFTAFQDGEVIKLLLKDLAWLLSKLSQGESATKDIQLAIENTLTTHGLDRIVKIFDPITGKVNAKSAAIAISWPKQPIDYNFYFRDRSVTDEFTKLYSKILSFIVSCYFSELKEECTFLNHAKALMDFSVSVDISKITDTPPFQAILGHSISNLDMEFSKIKKTWEDQLKFIKYDEHSDLFWPEIKNKNWSKDPIISKLKDYNSNSCNIFQIDIYKIQCYRIMKGVEILTETHFNKKVDIIKTKNFTPNQVRDWFSKIAMISEYAAFKLNELVSDMPKNILGIKLMKLDRYEYEVFPSRIPVMEKVVNQKRNASKDWTDYLICGGGGIGKSVFMNSLANKLNAINAPKFWISDGDLISGIAKLFETIFMGSDSWMRSSNADFKDALVKMIKDNELLLRNILFIIDSFDSEKMNAQIDIFKALAEISEVGFIFSSDDCGFSKDIKNFFQPIKTSNLRSQKLLTYELETPSNDELIGLFRSHLQKISSSNSSDVEAQFGEIIGSTGPLPINSIRALDFSVTLNADEFKIFMAYLDDNKDSKYNAIAAILKFLKSSVDYPEMVKLLTGLMMVSNPQVISSDTFDVDNLEGESFEAEFVNDLFSKISATDPNKLIEILKNARIIEIYDKNAKEIALHKGVMVELYAMLKEEHKDNLLQHLRGVYDTLITAINQKLVDVSIYSMDDNKHYQKSLAFALKSFIDESVDLLRTKHIGVDLLGVVNVLRKIGQIMELTSQQDAIYYFSAALEIISNYDSHLDFMNKHIMSSKINYQLAEIFHGIMNTPAAIAHYENSIRHIKEINDLAFSKYVEMLLSFSRIEIGYFNSEEISRFKMLDFDIKTFKALAASINDFPSLVPRNAALISDMLLTMPKSSLLSEFILDLGKSYLELLENYRNTYKDSFLPHFVELDLEIVQLVYALEHHGRINADVDVMHKLEIIFGTEANVGVLRAEALLRAMIVEGHYAYENKNHCKGLKYLESLLPTLRQSFDIISSEEKIYKTQTYLAKLAQKALSIAQVYLKHVKLNYEFCPVNEKLDQNKISWIEHVKTYANVAFKALQEAYNMSLAMNDRIGIKQAAELFIDNFPEYLAFTRDISLNLSLDEVVKEYIKVSTQDSLFEYAYEQKSSNDSTKKMLSEVARLLAAKEVKNDIIDTYKINQLAKELAASDAPADVLSALYGLAYEFGGEVSPLLKQEIIIGYVKSTLTYCLGLEINHVKFHCGNNLESIVLNEQPINIGLVDTGLLADVKQYMLDINYTEDQYRDEITLLKGSFYARRDIEEYHSNYYGEYLKNDNVLDYLERLSKIAEKPYYDSELI